MFRAVAVAICAAALWLLSATDAVADESAALFFVQQQAKTAPLHRQAHPHVFHRHRMAPAHAPAGARGVSLAGVYAPLAAKGRELSARCGSVVISGVRKTFVAGTRRRSEHWSGHAIDVTRNPRCIYARLRGWPGGYSTDYGRVHHVHISLGGHEDGKRFAYRHIPRRFAHRPHRHRLARL
ncbi:MAG: hypothetical protein KGL46_03900 [Hyphomicrobiales bacterium]|nr:hypothetical protein [Hyphomicrobiales bacterium]